MAGNFFDPNYWRQLEDNRLAQQTPAPAVKSPTPATTLPTVNPPPTQTAVKPIAPAPTNGNANKGLPAIPPPSPAAQRAAQQVMTSKPPSIPSVTPSPDAYRAADTVLANSKAPRKPLTQAEMLTAIGADKPGSWYSTNNLFYRNGDSKGYTYEEYMDLTQPGWREQVAADRAAHEAAGRVLVDDGKGNRYWTNPNAQPGAPPPGHEGFFYGKYYLNGSEVSQADYAAYMKAKQDAINARPGGGANAKLYALAGAVTPSPEAVAAADKVMTAPQPGPVASQERVPMQLLPEKQMQPSQGNAPFNFTPQTYQSDPALMSAIGFLTPEQQRAAAESQVNLAQQAAMDAYTRQRDRGLLDAQQAVEQLFGPTFERGLQIMRDREDQVLDQVSGGQLLGGTAFSPVGRGEVYNAQRPFTEAIEAQVGQQNLTAQQIADRYNLDRRQLDDAITQLLASRGDQINAAMEQLRQGERDAAMQRDDSLFDRNMAQNQFGMSAELGRVGAYDAAARLGMAQREQNTLLPLQAQQAQAQLQQAGIINQRGEIDLDMYRQFRNQVGFSPETDQYVLNNLQRQRSQIELEIATATQPMQVEEARKRLAQLDANIALTYANSAAAGQRNNAQMSPYNPFGLNPQQQFGAQEEIIAMYQDLALNDPGAVDRTDPINLQRWVRVGGNPADYFIRTGRPEVLTLLDQQALAQGQIKYLVNTPAVSDAYANFMDDSSSNLPSAPRTPAAGFGPGRMYNR